MKQFYLAEIVTKDKLIHQGIFFSPKKFGKKPHFAKASRGRAILWVHGLTSTFYNALTIHEAFVDTCEKEGWGYASFNNRGHGMVSGGRRLDRTEPNGYTYATIGAGNEKFEECFLDINAVVDFLVKKGFTEIVLVGHSSGANKVCYAEGIKPNPHVVGVLLASPTSDRLSPKGKPPWYGFLLANLLVSIGKGDVLIPNSHFPCTSKRFLSLFTPRSAEDTFDYGDPKPRLTYFSKIKKPLFVILGGADESLDRPAEEVKKVFDAHVLAKRYESAIIPHALHGFNGKEKELVDVIVRWIKRIG